ncbi:MAG: hypothetical protein ABR507_10060 [Actinomycetota bacterium]|nr:hypothetical protein [Actinomycetota bacterium]
MSKNLKFRPRRLGPLLALGCLLAAFAVIPVASSNQVHQTTGWITVPGQGPSLQVHGGWLVAASDDSVHHTHGPDGQIGGDDPVEMAKSAYTDGTCTAIGCLPGTSGPEEISCVPSSASHFAVIYARPLDGPDRSALIIPFLRHSIYDMSGFIDKRASSLSALARARLKVVCDTDGTPAVATSVLPTTSDADSFASIIGDLSTQGFNQTNTKYIVFYDDCPNPCYAGQGTVADDDSGSGGNSSNRGPDYAVEYSSLKLPAWNTLLHETSHAMGAVQNSAPHSSGAWHCNDGLDVMCYGDGGSTSAYDGNACADIVFDCNHDDYFDPNPSVGSYLSNHWNIAAAYNDFLDHS